MRDFLIKEKAFELPPIAEVSPRRLSKYLQSLYGRYARPCYDFYQSDYQQQMARLVDSFYHMAEHDERLDPELAWRVKENFGNIQYPSGTLQERKRYFVEIKENLEQILFLIKDQRPEKRTPFIIELGESIADCGPGAYTQLANALYDLKNKHSLPFWLANLRKNNLQLFGEQHIAKKSISDAFSMHVHIAFSKFAEVRGWGIPQANKLAVLPDQYAADARISARDLNELKFKFERAFCRQDLIDTTYVNLYALLGSYKNKDLSDPDRLDSFKRLIKAFLAQGIFDLNILEYDSNKRMTLIRAEFWNNLKFYCEVLLVKEGIILGKAEIQAYREKALSLLRTDWSANKSLKDKQRVVGELLGSMEKLSHFLFWLPEKVAKNLLNHLDPEQLRLLVTDRYELISLLYQLPLELGRHLLWCMGFDYVKSFFSGLTVFILETTLNTSHPISKLLPSCLPGETWKDKASLAIYQQVLSVLLVEKERLKKKYGSSCNRIPVLEGTIFQVLRCLEELPQNQLTRTGSYMLKDRLRAAIEDNLVSNNLDKYQGWGKKLALILLNTLLTLPLVTLPIKRMATGSWFFSLKGKSHEAGEKAVKNLNRMTVF